MKTWLRRIRGAFGMGLSWALAGALLGGVIEAITEFVPGWNGAVVDIWPAALGALGFLGGGAFAIMLGVAGRHRSFNELSLPRVAAWGATGGLLLGVALMGMAGALAPGHWLEAAVFIGTATAGSAVAAAGTLALARKGEDPKSLDAGPVFANLGLPNGPARGPGGGGG